MFKKISIIMVMICMFLSVFSDLSLRANTMSYADFLSLLEANSLPYREVSAYQDHLLSVPSQAVELHKELILVYEYSSCETMKQDAEGIDRHGAAFAHHAGEDIAVTIQVSWIAAPHFFKKGRIIVHYTGENHDILQFLRRHFGGEFAGAEPLLVQEYFDALFQKSLSPKELVTD